MTDAPTVTDVEQLLATVREALDFADHCVERLGVTGYERLSADAALDSLAASLVGLGFMLGRMWR